MRLYISGLPYSMTRDEDLAALFQYFGHFATKPQIICNIDGDSRGFGFCEVDNGYKVIDDIDGKAWEGRKLHCAEAQPRKPKSW
jgi:RNA recognition motif-containing protein